jgi:hypothetical protein
MSGRIILPPGTVIANRGDGWQQLAAPPIQGADESATFRHRGRQLTAIRSRDMGRWHLSVSHRDRIPTWAELGFARDSLLPEGVWLAIWHPPRKHWLNYDHRVLHLWESRDPELIEQFQFEGEEAQRAGYGRPS